MKKKLVFYSFTSVLILVVIIIFVNLISSYLFLRFDFSEGKIYSLSKASKKILARIPDRLIIKAYFTRDLPREYGLNRKYIEDLLSEYKIYSRGKIKFEFIDPALDKEALSEAKASGIIPVQFTQIEKDKYEVKEGYMGIVFLFGSKKEVIPVVKSTEGLEYDITDKIKKLISEKTKTIGFTTGHNENTEFGEMEQYIESQYNIKRLEKNAGKESFDQLTSLVIIGPKNKFEEKEISNIEEFLKSGKPVAFLIDKFNVNMQAFYAYKIETGLEKLLENYGIKILPGFVLDWQCQKIVIRTVQGFFTIQNIVGYPLYPVTTDISRTNPMVKDLESISFLYTSPIQIEEKKDFSYEVIIKSSKKSWYKENLYHLNPYIDYSPTKNDKIGQFNLGVIVKPNLQGGRVVVIGNSNFVQREQEFFMNLIDYLMQDEDLISIRSKGASYRPLRQTSYGLRLIFKYISIFFMPAIIVCYGIIRWKIRNIVKANYKNIYA